MPAACFPVLAVALLVGVYVIPLLAVLRPALDWDLWWHLRTGQWVGEHGHVPSNDPFSAYGAERSWVAYSWFFEIVVYGIYSRLGLTGVVLFRAAMALAVVAAFHRLVARRERRFLVSTLLAGVAALALVPLLNERPWLFTILFTTLTLDVLLDLREGRRSPMFWLLPFFYLLWANLHIQFVYGFLVLGIGCAAPLLDRLLGWPKAGARTGWQLAGLSAACGLATLVNPYGLRLYGVVIEYATQSLPFRVVAELTALDFREGRGWLVLGLALATAFALGRRQCLSSFELLLFAGSAVLCFRARRDLWLVVLSALVILPAVVPGRAGPVILGRRHVALTAVLVLGIGLGIAWARGLSEARLREGEASVFPTRACEAVQRRGYRGPLYNSFDWGGYLIWRLPDLPVSIDGRTNLHGEERIQRALDTWAGRKGWSADVELATAHLVIAEASAPLASLLRTDGRFELVYEDEQAVVFVRP
ncbi:MAG: hypothetical protein HYS12_23005 [Planctomycetes bacterium]|nr:hypothetical protein [Planctomycetota bacterium]